MTELDFQSLAKQGYTRVPVVAEARADLYTPLAVYLKLANGPYTYLLESVVGGERFGRYSFIGLACAERIDVRGGDVRRLLRDARGTDVVHRAQRRTRIHSNTCAATLRGSTWRRCRRHCASAAGWSATSAMNPSGMSSPGR